MSDPPRGSDIFSGQAGDPDLLAEIYDLEHDEITQDHAFYRELVRRNPGSILDLGCGSGRLFAALLAGGATRIVGVDGSTALLRRAELRMDRDPELAKARDEGRLALVTGDVRRPPLRERFSLALAVGVVPHLDGPEEALRMIVSVGDRLEPHGLLVLDDIGPGALPWRDLPLSFDWEREIDGRRVIRRSHIVRRERPEGLRVAYTTLTDTVRSDGTIARLPASFRLWYPFDDVLQELLVQGGFVTELTYGSHDLEPVNRESERRIVVARRTG